jgi:hypothetical protein
MMTTRALTIFVMSDDQRSAAATTQEVENKISNFVISSDF